MTSSVELHKSLPATIKPMLARHSRYPFDSPNHIFELKWDGIRALAFIEGNHLRLQGRSLRSVTSQFPELSRLPNQVKADGVVIDGEIVCLDVDGHPSLQRLQKRLQRAGDGTSKGPRAHYIAFDLLYINGLSLMGEPLVSRKNLLHEVLEPSGFVQACEFIEANGAAFFQATCEHGLEGIIAKDKSSLYFPGRRSSSWLKVKRIRESDFVIGGYTFGGYTFEGMRKESFSSLLLGLYDDDQNFVFVGQVAAGFARSKRRQLYLTLQDLQTIDSPFAQQPQVHDFHYWCRPELVCQVEYGEVSMDGKLRYPMFITLNEDKSPRDCTLADTSAWPVSASGKRTI